MSTLNILIIEQSSGDDEFKKALTPLGHITTSITLESLEITQLTESIKPHAILFNANQPTEPILQSISEINHNYAVPIILFSNDADTKAINQVIKAGVSAYIVNGLESKRIKSIIDIAIARFEQQKSLKDELKKTKFKLEERKLIDRAKGILITTRGFSENESYHTLRKLAMDRNIPIAEMAKNVISMAELLK